MTHNGEAPGNWKLRVLDSFCLTHNGEVVKLFGVSRPDMLLAYLSLHEGYTIPRADVAYFLWPNKPEQSGRKLLTEVLFRLNRDLKEVGAPEDFVIGDKQLLGLNPNIRTDLGQFRNLARAHQSTTPEEQRQILQEMEDLYGHGLLPLLRAPQIARERASLETMLEEARHRVTQNTPVVIGQVAGLDVSLPPSDLPPAGFEEFAPPSIETYDLPSLNRLCRLHAERCAALARDAEPHLYGPGRQAWVRRLNRYAVHLQRALDWVIEQEDWQLGFRIAAPLWRYWLLGPHRSQGRAYLDQIVVGGHTHDRALHATALQGSGALAAMAGDYPQARRRLDQALGVWEKVGDRRSYARTIEDIGLAAYRQGHFAEARTKYDEALAILQDLGDRYGEMVCLKNASLLALQQRRAAEARELLTRCLEIAREQQDAFAEADALSNLATSAQFEEDWKLAEDLTTQSLRLFQELQAPLKVGFALRTRGYILQHTQRVEEARAAYQASLELAQQTKHLRGMGESLRCLGELEAELGHRGVARDLLTKAESVLEADGDVVGVGKVRQALAALPSPE